MDGENRRRPTRFAASLPQSGESECEKAMLTCVGARTGLCRETKARAHEFWFTTSSASVEENSLHFSWPRSAKDIEAASEREFQRGVAIERTKVRAERRERFGN